MAIFRIELGKGGWKVRKRSAQDFNIIGTAQVGRQCRRRRKSFEILGEDLAAAASTLAMFQRAEPGLQDVVRAIDQTYASAAFLRNRNDMPPEVGAVTIEVRQDEIDCRAQILGGAAFGASLLQ